MYYNPDICFLELFNTRNFMKSLTKYIIIYNAIHLALLLLPLLSFLLEKEKMINERKKDEEK